MSTHPQNIGGYTGHQSPADLERRQYERWRDHIRKAETAEDYLRDTRAVARFLNDEPNPVYGDALVNVVLVEGYRLVLRLQDEVPTYGAMMITRVSSAALHIESLWRGIMDHNASHPE